MNVTEYDMTGDARFLSNLLARNMMEKISIDHDIEYQATELCSLVVCGYVTCLACSKENILELYSTLTNEEILVFGLKVISEKAHEILQPEAKRYLDMYTKEPERFSQILSVLRSAVRIQLKNHNRK